MNQGLRCPLSTRGAKDPVEPWRAEQARECRSPQASAAPERVARRAGFYGCGCGCGVSVVGRAAVSVSTDRIAGSGGGEPDSVLLCGPHRRLRWRRPRSGLLPGPPAGAAALSHPGSLRGLSPPPSSMLCALLAERRHRGPAAEASGSLVAVCRTLRATQRRPWPPSLAARQPRGPSSRSAGPGVSGTLRELLLGGVAGGGAERRWRKGSVPSGVRCGPEQRWLTGCAPSGTGTGTFAGRGLWRRGGAAVS